MSALGGSLLCNGQELPVVLPVGVTFYWSLAGQCLLHVSQQQVSLLGWQAAAHLTQPFQEWQLLWKLPKSISHPILQPKKQSSWIDVSFLTFHADATFMTVLIV